MKYILTSFIILASLISSFGQDVFKSGDHLALDFKQMNIDLGKVNHGDTETTAFEFLNAGKEDIEIDIVDGCVCTTLDWTRGVIKPGESGKIDVIFDSTEKEKSEVIDIDVTLKNTEKESGNPIFIFLTYKYELVK